MSILSLSLKNFKVTKLLNYPILFTNFISSHTSLTVSLPHISLTLSLPHAFAAVKPPPRLRLTPPSCLRLRLRLPHASCLLQPHLTSRHASLSLTSRLTLGDFISTVLLLSLSSLRCAKGRQLSLSLWFGVCKGRKISLCSSSLSDNRLIQKKKKL